MFGAKDMYEFSVTKNSWKQIGQTTEDTVLFLGPSTEEEL